MARNFILCFLLCFQILFFSICFAKDDNLVVQTANGKLRGKLATTRGMQVRQFLGIPYAQPPVGELRFAKPKPFGSWEGVRDAVEFGQDCAQAEIVSLLSNLNITFDNGKPVPQSEDCLFLNVYTPPKANPSDKLAVMVWIHGGGFEVGSGRRYNPSLLVALYNVVMVTINYRLSVFGFFNIPESDVKGNYGMHDQILSLQWVQQNVAAFGGNPDQVTIFGESAGGMSVSSLLLSPLSKGLFHRVIEQSGSSVSSFGFRRVSSMQADLDVFKKAIQCYGDHDKMMECLRKKSADEIFAAQTNYSLTMQMIGPEYLTRPGVDGEYLPDDAKTLFQKGQVNKADVMLGFTANDGAAISFFCAKEVKMFDIEVFKACNVPILTMFGGYSKLGEEAVIMEYLGGGTVSDSDQIRQEMGNVVTDMAFMAPAVQEGDLLLKAGNPVYMYVMDHEPHAPRFPKWLGAYHGYDLAYTFGLPLDNKALGYLDLGLLIPSNYSALEEGFSKYVMQLWTNFAKYGNPNADGHMPVTWPQYDQEHAHLRLSTRPRIQRGLRERKLKFWMDFFPKLTGTERQNEAKGTEANTPKEEL